MFLTPFIYLRVASLFTNSEHMMQIQSSNVEQNMAPSDRPQHKAFLYVHKSAGILNIIEKFLFLAIISNRTQVHQPQSFNSPSHDKDKHRNKTKELIKVRLYP